MDDLLFLMLRPAVACFILTGIHAYLGLHVVERGVIFVDLALSQLAAFGAIFGIALGFSLHSNQAYLLSLGFAVVGAGLFAVTRKRNPIIPHEAIIGVVYAVAASGSVLALSKMPDGGEELKNLLVGHLLFISWNEIIKIAIIYSIIGALHFCVRHKMFLVSRQPELAFEKGMSVKLWDFLFYVSLGVIVTSSVEVGGVLLVFCFLVVPALCGIICAKTDRARLFTAWLVGVVSTFVGMLASYQFDLPTGAVMAVVLGLSLLVISSIRSLKHSV